MQSSFAPELLNKNQYAFGQNNSIRNGFIHPRPPYQIQTLNFNGNAALQNLVQTGFFQGAGYYRPDAGPESIVAQISGHLILFTVKGSSWSVTDISIPNDLNSATAPQVWMWQAEKWLIVQDGTGVLPIFYDGTISRRSFGATQLLGTTNADFTIPAIGGDVTLTLEEPYTGPYNIPVIIDGEFYQPVQSASGYPVILTNLTAMVGETIPSGSQLVIQPNVIASVTDFIGAFAPGVGKLITYVSISNPNPPVDGPPARISVNVSGATLQPYSNGAPYGSPIPVAQPMTLERTSDPLYFVLRITYSAYGYLIIPVGALITNSNTSPSVPIGTTKIDFIVPAVNQQVNVVLNAPFTGSNGQVVYIGTEAFSIANPATPPAGTSLIVINLTDTKTGTVAQPATIMSVPEILAGRCGGYGMGCNVFSLTDGISYVIGDVVGSASGTPALNYRDAVLKITQNTFLAGGGSFRLPGTGDSISAIIFPTIQDASLGQGPAVVGTPFSMFSNAVPGTNPSTWDTLNFPIQTESLKDKGPEGQWNTIIVNSDVFFRSYDGVGTLVSARREFFDWGNTPISSEMQRPLDADDPTLLNYGSMISFDNRVICTSSPVSTTNGTVHQSLVTLQLQLQNTVQKKSPPTWEGMWTGLNIFQLICGRFNGVRRAFALCFNFQFTGFELYELLPEKTSQFSDNGNTQIKWAVETATFFGSNIKPDTDLCQLRDGEVYISNIQGQVHVDVFYRPDYYSCWTKWNGFDVCQQSPQGNSKPGYRTRIGLGEPSGQVYEVGNNRPLRQGNFFQFRIEITGSCVFNRMKASAVYVAEQTYAPIQISEKPCQVIDCDLPDDLSFYQLEGNPTPAVPPSIPAGPTPFNNQQVVFNHNCGAGSLLLSTVNFPTWITLDPVNQQVIGAAGQFQAATQAEANLLAQTALDEFSNNLLNSGELFCTSTSPASCAGTETNAYKILGYFDGLLANPQGQPSGNTPWDGTFQFQQTGNLCLWAGANALFSTMAGGATTCLHLSFTGSFWALQIYGWLGAGSAAAYTAIKFSGNTPAGVYTFAGGAAGGPPTVTIVPMSGTTTTQIIVAAC
jgi:hypothetical protein